MLAPQVSSTQSANGTLTRIGVGIDTSRYGHYAAFVREDQQPAAGELQRLVRGSSNKPITLSL